MAVKKENSVTINTYDMIHVLQQELVTDFFNSDIKQWDWIEKVQSEDAHEYYYSHVTTAKNEVLEYIKSFKSEKHEHITRNLEIGYYISSKGELGEFASQTRSQHGDLVAFYILQIATTDPDATHRSFNRSDIIRRSSTYEYHLAHFLYFQHINAGDYILGHTNKKLHVIVDNFSSAARATIEEIKTTGDTARQLLSDTSRDLIRGHTRNKRRAFTVLRRYKGVFKTVREEAHATKIAAKNDLENAYQTYHAQVDLKSSIVYWNEKVIRHNKSKWKWLGVVVASVILTFASPVIYYSAGGASALAEKNNKDTLQASRAPQSPATPKNSETAPNPESKGKDNAEFTTNETLQKVAFASGIADLTGAALIVALMSVLLRLSLRQYNTYMFLSNDAEERVTMLKTYIALSNEGKLTADGDMKLVLEALFRPSQSGAIPDSTPATPIELVIKAITERK